MEKLCGDLVLSQILIAIDNPELEALALVRYFDDGSFHQHAIKGRRLVLHVLCLNLESRLTK